MTTELDSLLERLKVDVPEPPTVGELRSRVEFRHRRPLTVVVVLAALVLIAVGLGTVSGRSGPERNELAGEEAAAPPRYRVVTVTIGGSGDGPVAIMQASSSVPHVVSDRMLVNTSYVVVSTGEVGLVEVTEPKWNLPPTADGQVYVGNDICPFAEACSAAPREFTLGPGGVSGRLQVAIDVFQLPFGRSVLSDEVHYVVPETGEVGSVDVEVTMVIRERDATDPTDPGVPTTVTW